MKIHFIGVGEAFDETQSNTSVLVRDKLNILLDCGFLAVKNFWKNYPDSSFLDLIYISHTHADHYFGLAPLFLRMTEEGRKKEIKIICQKEDVQKISDSFKLAYEKIIPDQLSFTVKFLPISRKTILKINSTTFRFARTDHSQSNLAIRIERSGKSVCYSGDGKFTKESEKLYRKTDLLIHEAYLLSEFNPYHGNIADVFNMAVKQKVKNLALVHINRQVRRNLTKIKKQFDSKKINLFFPDQNSTLEV